MKKDWRTRRISRRYVYALGTLLVLLPLAFASQAPAAHITLADPPSFTFVSDEACRTPNASSLCPDDQPGQKDLSAHAVANPVPGDLWVAWKWDVTGLSGGNTGDACSLFDTDSTPDGKVNSAICVTIGGDPAAQLTLSPRVYTCGNGKVDRCTSTVTQVSPIHSVCGVGTGSDPFHSGQQDTQATCHVYLPDLNATVAGLVNTCSYPSEQPNSDPSDCVLVPRDAFIRIVKDATPNAGTFAFLLNGAATGIVFTSTGSNTATGDETSNLIPIKSGTSQSVKETVPSGWDLTSASCSGTSGAGTSNGTFSVDTISGIVAASDQTVTCTFSNRQRASVNITKTGSDAGAQTGAVFTLYAGANTSGTVIGMCTVIASGQCGASPSFSSLVPGQYTVDETTVPTGYNKASNLPYTFTLSAGQALSISFENAAQPGSAAITKLDDAGNPVSGAVFTVYQAASGTTSPPTGSAVGTCMTSNLAPPPLGTCTISNLAPGTYTIDEVPPSGYAKDSTFPKDITIVRGQTLQVSATDPRQFKAIVIVCRQHDSKLYSSAITINGTSAGMSLASAPTGITESTLCGLTAGARSGLLRSGNNHSATINIP